MWAAIAAIFNMFTRGANVIDINMQSLEKLSEAGLQKATQFKQEQDAELEQRRIKLEEKKRILKAQIEEKKALENKPS